MFLSIRRSHALFPSLARYASTNTNTIGAMLNASAEKYPHKDAIRFVEEDLIFSFKDLNKEVDEFSSGLLNMNLQLGDTIAVWLPNSSDKLISIMGAAKAGVKVAAIDSAIHDPEHLRYILKDSKCTSLFYAPKMENHDITQIVQDLLPELEASKWNSELIIFKQFPYLRHVVTTGDYERNGVIKCSELPVNAYDPYWIEKRTKSITPDTPFVETYQLNEQGEIQKNTALTQEELLAEGQKLATKLELNASDKICITKDCPGVSAATIASLQTNAQMVVPSDHPNEELEAKAMSLEKFNIKGSGFTMYQRL